VERRVPCQAHFNWTEVEGGTTPPACTKVPPFFRRRVAVILARCQDIELRYAFERRAMHRRTRAAHARNSRTGLVGGDDDQPVDQPRVHRRSCSLRRRHFTLGHSDLVEFERSKMERTVCSKVVTGTKPKGPGGDTVAAALMSLHARWRNQREEESERRP
jgi:hypothetical protein